MKDPMNKYFNISQDENGNLQITPTSENTGREAREEIIELKNNITGEEKNFTVKQNSNGEFTDIEGEIFSIDSDSNSFSIIITTNNSPDKFRFCLSNGFSGGGLSVNSRLFVSPSELESLQPISYDESSLGTSINSFGTIKINEENINSLIESGENIFTPSFLPSEQENVVTITDVYKFDSSISNDLGKYESYRIEIPILFNNSNQSTDYIQGVIFSFSDNIESRSIFIFQKALSYKLEYLELYSNSSYTIPISDSLRWGFEDISEKIIYIKSNINNYSINITD